MCITIEVRCNITIPKFAHYFPIIEYCKIRSFWNNAEIVLLSVFELASKFKLPDAIYVDDWAVCISEGQNQGFALARICASFAMFNICFLFMETLKMFMKIEILPRQNVFHVNIYIIADF